MSFSDKVQGAKDTAVKAVNAARKVKNIAKFFATVVGQIVLWVIIILLAIILLYILVNTISKGIAKIFGIENPGLKESADYQILLELQNSGYNTLMDSKELQSYLIYEYGVLMDAARFFHDTGVYEMTLNDKAEIDLSVLDNEQRAQLIAAQKSGNSELIKKAEKEIGKAQLAIEGNKRYREAIQTLDDEMGELKKEKSELEKKLTTETDERNKKVYMLKITNIESQIQEIEKYGKKELDGIMKRVDDNTTYTSVSTQIKKVLEKYVDRKRRLTNVDSSRELFYKIAGNEGMKDSAENSEQASDNVKNMWDDDEGIYKSLMPYLRIYREAVINTYYIMDGEENQIINQPVDAINQGRYDQIQRAVTKAQAGDDSALKAFTRTSKGYYINVDLNSRNYELWTNSKLPNTNTVLTLTKEYEKDQLFYQKRDDGSASYEIPFKVIVDRFLPKASLLSSWYMLKDSNDGEDDTRGEIDELLQDIKDLYNKACLELEETDKEISHTMLRQYSDRLDELDDTNEYVLLKQAYAGLMEEETKEFEKGNYPNLTNEYSFVEFDRTLLEMNNLGDWELGKTEKFVPVTDLVHALDFNGLSAGVSHSGQVVDENGMAVDVSTKINNALSKILSGTEMIRVGGKLYKLCGIEGKGVIKEADETGEYDLSPLEYPSHDMVDVDNWYYVRDENGEKQKIDDANGIYNGIYAKLNSLLDNWLKTLYQVDERGNITPITSGLYVSRGSSTPKAVFTVEERTFGITQQVKIKKMPVYFPKNVWTWSRDIEYSNNVEVGGKFDQNNFNYLIPTGDKYACGFQRMDVDDNSEWRVELYGEILGKKDEKEGRVRENDVIAMLSEWEQAAEDDIYAADTYIRELYKLIEYSKPKYSPDKKYIDEDSYTYINIADEILYYDEHTTDMSFWLEHFLASQDDPIKAEENVTMRSRLDVMKWQNVEYELYEECYDVENDKYKVYALWPEGGYMAKAHYALSANATDYANDVVESWGGWKFNGSHAGVDIYGRRTSDTLARSFASQIKSKIDGNKVILTDENGNPLTGNKSDGINSSKFEKLAAADTGLYVKGATTTLILDGNEYKFPGTAAAVYGYELYRLTKVLGNANQASGTLLKTLNDEAKDTPLVAVAPGIVTSVRVGPVCGFGVTVEHTRGDKVIYTNYVHMKRWPKVQMGEYVGAGTLLGYEGTTGASKGLHVHFELAETVSNTSSSGGESSETLTTLQKGTYPIPYLYPFFTPFYNDELAEKNNYEKDSEYMSLLRTVYPVGQKIGDDLAGRIVSEQITVGKEKKTETVKKLLKRNAHWVPYRAGYSIEQVELNDDNTVKIKNYTPTLPLVSDVSTLPTKSDERLKEGFLLEKEALYTTGAVTYSDKEDVKPLDIYYNNIFLKVVSELDGYVYTGDIDISKLIFDNYRGKNASKEKKGKPMLGDEGWSFSVKQWKNFDEKLANKVATAGYGSRSGVVAAARFLAGMPYAVPYLGSKRGSTTVGSYPYMGLNNTWGQRVTAAGEVYNRNGFDCTGFLTWAMINGGVLSELEGVESVYSDTTGLNKSADVIDQIKVGDWMYNDGSDNGQTVFHVGIIIGEDSEYFYVAEEIGSSLIITRFSKSQGCAIDDDGKELPGRLTYVRLADERYPSVGNYFDENGNYTFSEDWYDINKNKVGTW